MQLCSAENFPSSPVRHLIQKQFLASDEAFKKFHRSLPRHDICRVLFLLNHLRTFRVQLLLSDIMLCVQSPVNLLLRPAAVGCSLQ